MEKTIFNNDIQNMKNYIMFEITVVWDSVFYPSDFVGQNIFLPTTDIKESLIVRW